MSLIVNLFGGPGTGKSTACAQIFAELKWRNINCEMVLEYAKDKVWEEHLKILDNQIYIFGKQLQRIVRVVDKVDVVVSDSPLLLSILYDKSGSSNFHKLIVEKHHAFPTLNIFLKRKKLYSEVGRNQTEEEAIELDEKLLSILNAYDIPYIIIDATKEAIVTIPDLIENELLRLNPPMPFGYGFINPPYDEPVRRQLVLNSIVTPDGTVLISHHVHDYVTHIDAISGEEYMVDGGLDYCRRNVNVTPYHDQSVYLDDPYVIVREAFTWGTRGKSGNEPLRYVPMSELSNNHIYAILDTQKQISQWVRDLFNKELKYREENPSLNIKE